MRKALVTPVHHHLLDEGAFPSAHRPIQDDILHFLSAEVFVKKILEANGMIARTLELVLDCQIWRWFQDFLQGALPDHRIDVGGIQGKGRSKLSLLVGLPAKPIRQTFLVFLDGFCGGTREGKLRRR